MPYAYELAYQRYLYNMYKYVKISPYYLLWLINE